MIDWLADHLMGVGVLVEGAMALLGLAVTSMSVSYAVYWGTRLLGFTEVAARMKKDDYMPVGLTIFCLTGAVLHEIL